MKTDKEHQTMKNLLIKGDNIKGLYYLLQTRKLKGKIDQFILTHPLQRAEISLSQMVEHLQLAIQEMARLPIQINSSERFLLSF